MVYDDIVIGSGLSALATVVGLSPAKRILVIGGPKTGSFRHYHSAVSAPNAYLGHGGLGNYWHGVIPMRDAASSDFFSAASYEALFRHFYPSTKIADRIGKNQLFVPHKAIRPVLEWKRLIKERAEKLVISEEFVRDIAVSGSSATVSTQSSNFTGNRLWLCAGVLHTPLLLTRLFGDGIVSPSVSDHVICYLGQIDRQAHPGVEAPKVERVAGGMWYHVGYGTSKTSLVSRKPARFSYTTLDHAIEERAVFGLPTANAVSKILQKFSPGLIAEAFFNRYGLFPTSRVQSVYAQVVVPQAYAFDFKTGGLAANVHAIRAAIENVHALDAGAELTHSMRRDLYIPGIHLHGSLDQSAMEKLDINKPESVVQVSDASAHVDLGPEHHSFKVMAAAMQKASRL